MKSLAVQAVLVLYDINPEESSTYRGWAESQSNDSAFHAMADLMICDNSSGAVRTAPPGFRGIYLHDPSNPGLAKSYNRALKRAESNGSRWLLLLDQDTELTEDYLHEVAAMVTADTGEYGVLAPKLLAGSRLLSPHIPMYAPLQPPLSAEVSGPQTRTLSFFNSAALFRVASLKGIGGFPEEFWLDYLDHAVFHQLQQKQERVFILKSSLQHSLSSMAADAEEDPRWVRRQVNILHAQFRFYARYGDKGALLRHRKHLVLQALRSAAQGKLRAAKRLLQTCLRSKAA